LNSNKTALRRTDKCAAWLGKANEAGNGMFGKAAGRVDMAKRDT